MKQKTLSKKDQLAQVCIDLEKEIMDLWSNSTNYCPINNEDWTDDHQSYLETQWAKEELNGMYIEAQKEFFAFIGSTKKPKTAREYYKSQKELQRTIKMYREKGINSTKKVTK